MDGIQGRHNGGYAINREGIVIDTKTGYRVPWSLHGRGYPQVHLDGQTTLIHRMLAEKYLPNPDNLPVVKHLDHDKTNWGLDNLQWATQQENMADSLAKTYTMTNPKGERVSFTNMQEFCRDNNLSPQNLGKVYLKQRHSHKGWTK